MAKRLKTYVHVLGDDGENQIFGPEDDVPQEFAEKIGDHAWVDADEPLPDNRPGVVVENPGPGAQPRVEIDADDDGGDDSDGDEDADGGEQKAPAKRAPAKRAPARR